MKRNTYFSYRAVRGVALAGLVSATLAGCAGENLDDLRTYVDGVKARSTARIEPLPELKPYETFTYHATDLTRDPFALGDKIGEQAAIASTPGGSGIQPDFNRRKEALEEFSLDTLRMVGSLKKEEQTWAIISASDGTIHRIKAGDYVGQNHGKITLVSEEKLMLTEIVPDGLGGWTEREASLALSE